MANGIPPFGLSLDPRLLAGLASQSQRGGLMGDGQQEQDPSFWDRISRLWAGRPDERVSSEREEEIRRDALIAAGLQMMARSSDPNITPHIMSIIAQGAAGGQRYAQGARQQAIDESRRARLAALVQDGTVDDATLEQLFAQSLAEGDMDSARVLSEVIKSRKSSQNLGIRTVQTDNETIVMDNQGNEIRRYPRRQGTERYTVVEDGTEYYVWADEEGNELRRRAKGPATQVGRDYSATNQLMNRYLSQTNDDRKVADLYGTVVAAARDPSPAGDLSMIFAYMKVLDPGSVVREGEFATAANTGSIPTRIWAKYNRMLGGERLTDSQRQDFLNQAAAVAKERSNKLQRVIEWYRDIATRRGLNPDDVAYNYYELYFPQTADQGEGEGTGAAGQTGDALDGYLPGGGQ